MDYFEQVIYATTTQTTGMLGSARRSDWNKFLVTFATVSSVVLVLMVVPSYGQTATQKENTQKEATRIQTQGTKTQLNSAQLASEPDISPAALRPFHINVPEADLVDLRRRVLATRWPDRETVTDQSQGVQLAKLQALVRYWGTSYDWRKAEATLNALPRRRHSICAHVPGKRVKAIGKDGQLTDCSS